MQRHNQERQEAEMIATDELSSAQYEIELLREQVEISREQIETLNSELNYTQQQIQDLEQELKYTNQELCHALRFQQLVHGEAKQIAHKILKSHKSTSESLAEFLTAIYGCATQSDQLDHLDSLNTKTTLITAETKQIVDRSKQIQFQYKKLKDQFASLKNNFLNLSVYNTESVIEMKEKQINNIYFYNQPLNSFPPPPPDFF